MTRRQKKKFQKKHGCKTYQNARERAIADYAYEYAKSKGWDTSSLMVYTVWSRSGKRIMDVTVLSGVEPYTRNIESQSEESLPWFKQPTESPLFKQLTDTFIRGLNDPSILKDSEGK